MEKEHVPIKMYQFFFKVPELVFVSVSNVVSSCDGAVETTEPVATSISLHAMGSIIMHIIMTINS